MTLLEDHRNFQEVAALTRLGTGDFMEVAARRAGNPRTDEYGSYGGYGAGEQHADPWAEVLVRSAQQRAADRRSADEDKQVNAHDSAANRAGAAACTVARADVNNNSVVAPMTRRRTQKPISPGTAAATTWTDASTALTITSDRNVVRARRAEMSAPVSEPTATVALSHPYPDGPEWKTDRA